MIFPFAGQMKQTKQSLTTPYTDPEAFERLIVLIATLIKYPGVGSSDRTKKLEGRHHHALLEVQDKLQEVADNLGVNVSKCSIHALRKDLGFLRRWGILEQQMYRWGYYLGTGAMNQAELQVAFNALQSQAKYQQDRQVCEVYQTLAKRLRGLELDALYPVRTHIDRVIIYTDPAEMMAQGQYRGTLFEKLEVLEKAISIGQAVEVYRCRNPYKVGDNRYLQIYPLQLVYSEIAWYLLHEDCQTKHLALSRLDRFNDHFKEIAFPKRGAKVQLQSLQVAHQLLESGWGLYLGSSEEQFLEKQGRLKLINVTVRFFPDVMNFILEGEKRHPSQQINVGEKAKNGRPSYVDYTVELPRRSLNEFCYWTCRFMGNAQFLSPVELINKHKNMAYDLLNRYSEV
jgi:predicted DNA-binding transcriptional regulator YafY